MMSRVKCKNGVELPMSENPLFFSLHKSVLLSVVAVEYG